MKTAALRTLLLLLALVSLPCMAAFGDLLKKLEENIGSVTADPTGGTDSALDIDTLAAGLKEALRVGSQRGVAQVSATDGFFANPAIRIPLPAPVEQSAALLRRFGLGSLVDDLELSMNRAAEQAAPAASEHLLAALEAMTLDDARAIYNGPEDAATRYFERHTATRIGADFQPRIRSAMDQIGVSRYYQALVDQAAQYPLVGSLNLDLEQHVTDAAVRGLFTTLAEQEALIRRDPAARTTELLKEVFGR